MRWQSHFQIVLATSLVASLTLVMLSACAVPSTTPTATAIPTTPVADSPTPELVATPTLPATSIAPTETPETPTPPAATSASTETPVTPTPPAATPVPTETAATPTPPTVTPIPTETPAASAQYQLTFEATWSEVTHPTDFPPNPHFSGLIGAAHNPTVHLWKEGETATPGIKNMAETGSKSPLDSEIESLIGGGDACAIISGGGIAVSPGVVTVTFTVRRECPLVSVVSMIAPSPDWFVGVSGLSLYENGAWIKHKVMELFPYDAGTDSGVSYTSPNEPTASPEAIHSIETAPLVIDGSVPPLGTFTFSCLDD